MANPQDLFTLCKLFFNIIIILIKETRFSHKPATHTEKVNQEKKRKEFTVSYYTVKERRERKDG